MSVREINSETNTSTFTSSDSVWNEWPQPSLEVPRLSRLARARGAGAGDSSVSRDPAGVDSKQQT